MDSTLTKLRVSFFAAMVIIGLSQLTGAWLFLDRFWLVLPQLLYRNTGAYAGTRVRDYQNAGFPFKDAVNTVSLDFAKYLPGANLIVKSERFGTILPPDCQAPEPSTFAALKNAFSGPNQPEYPLTYRSHCASSEVLLGGDASAGLEKNDLLLLTKSASVEQNPTLPFEIKSDYLLRALGPLAFLVIWFIAWESFFRRLFKKSDEAALERAQNFAAGDLSSRFEKGGFFEHEDLALTFNTLAEEVSSRVKQLREDEALRKRFVAELAHDLRTPMTAIEGCISLLDKEEKADEYEHLLQITQQGANAQLEISTYIHELADLSGDAREFTEAACDAEVVLSNTKRIAAPIAENRGVTLNVLQGQGPFPFRGDEELVKRALLNLLDNAFRFTAAGETVDLRLLINHLGSVAFEVENPSGDRPEEARVFEGSSMNPPPIRTGLGLSIVKRIASLHGGVLEFDELNSGRIRVRLTLAASPPKSVQNSVPETQENHVHDSLSLKDLRVAQTIFFAALTISLSAAVLERSLLPLCLGTLTPSFLYYFSALLCGRLVVATSFCLAACIVVPILFMSQPWLFLIGVGFGTWSAVIALSMARFPFLRSAGAWFAGAGLIGSGISLLFMALLCRSITLNSLESHAEQELPSLSRNLLSDLESLEGNKAWQSAFLLHASFVNPLYDFALFEPDLSQHIATGWQASEFASSLSSVSRSPLKGTVEQGKVHFFRSHAERSVTRLAVRSPSVEAKAIAAREISNLLAPFVLGGLGLVLAIFLLLAIYWTALFCRDFDVLQKKLARYRSGFYGGDSPRLKGTDLFRLENSLERMAMRISTLESEISEERERLRRFLLNVSRAVRSGAEAIHAAASVLRPEESREGFSRLDQASAMQRQTIQNLFSMAHPGERQFLRFSELLSVTEIIEDEIEMLEASTELSVELSVALCDTSVEVSSHLLLQAVRLLLQAAAERCGDSRRIAIDIACSDDGIGISISDNGTALSEAIIHYLLHPFDADESDTDDIERSLPSALRGFSLAKTAQLVSESGGALRLKATKESGTEYLLFLPKTPRFKKEDVWITPA